MLKALYYPDVKFESLFIPFIYKEIYFDNIYTDVVNGKTDMTIIDVGANIGVVTQFLKDYAKKVYAIEPSTIHFEALKKNKEFNNWDNVEVFNLALADTDGEMELALNKYNQTMHTLVIDQKVGEDKYSIKDGGGLVLTAKGYDTREKVKTMRFDTFMKENGIEQVDFCKFDVEGAEDMILRSEGFKNVADKVKSIEIEFHYPTYPELVKYMISLGYQARRYDCSAVVILFFR